MKKSILVLFPFLSVILGCTAFGTSPSKESQKGFVGSSQYDINKKKFTNRRADIVDKMYEKNMSFSNIFKFFFADIPNRKPSKKLAEIKPDMKKFLESDQDMKVIWLGHSSLLINLEGKIILIDPVLSDNASPVSFTTKRFQPSVLQLEELPKIDYIVISHDHYDHLDMKTVKYFVGKDVTFLTPLGVGSHLVGWGIDKSNIIEKDWWESYRVNGIEFIATPAQHFSGRGLFDRDHTLWASWVIKSESFNLFYSGDTGYDTHFTEIGDRFGPFDLAFIESGQYNENWEEVHLLPSKFEMTYRELKAKRYFPIHWGMFVLSYHTWDEPIKMLDQLSRDTDLNLVAPMLGEVLDLKEYNKNISWWAD